MKLPGIQYGPVQQSRRQDIAAPIREAQAWGRATQAWTDAVDTVVDQITDTQAMEAEAKAIQQVDQAEFLMRRGTWNVQELGQPPDEVKIRTRQTLGDQDYYSTHEFADGYYDYAAKKAIADNSQNLWGPAKRKFEQRFNAYVSKRRAHVREDQFKRAQDFGRGVLNNAIATAVSETTWETRNETIVRVNGMIAEAARSGVIDMVGAEKARAQALDDITYMGVLNRVRMADDYSDLEEVELGLHDAMIDGQPAVMSPGAFSRALQDIDRREIELERELRRRQNETFGHALALQAENRLTEADELDLVRSQGLSGQQYISLQAQKSKAAEIKFINKADRNAWSGRIGRLRFLRDGETIESTYNKIARDLLAANRGHYEDGTLYQGKRITNEDYEQLDLDLQQRRRAVMNDPMYTQVMRDIAKVTQIDSDIVDIEGAANNRRAYQAFSQAANAYYQRMGADADMQKWFSDNVSKYTPELYGMGMEASRLKTYGVPARYFSIKEGTYDTFTVDSAGVAAWAQAKYNVGDLSEGDYQQIMSTLTLVPDASPEDTEAAIESISEPMFEEY